MKEVKRVSEGHEPSNDMKNMLKCHKVTQQRKAVQKDCKNLSMNSVERI